MWSWTPRAWRAGSVLHRGRDLCDSRRSYASLSGWRQANPAQACSIWLSCALLHEVMAPDDAGFDDDGSLLAWARAQALHYHSAEAESWSWAAWHDGRVRGASALHGLTLASLRDEARQCGLRLVAVAPWWSAVLRQARRDGVLRRRDRSRLLVMEGPQTVQIDVDHDRLVRVRHRHLDGTDPQSLAALLEGDEPRRTVAIGYGWTGDAPSGVDLPDGLDGLRSSRPPERWLP